MKISCTAVLMAGGRSSRMGCEKALLTCEGGELWRVQYEKLLGLAGEVLISARPGLLDIPVVEDETPGLGPLGGLRSVLAVARHERVLLLGVDMPRMTAEYLAMLVERATDACGVMPELDGFYQGLAAVYPRCILPLVEKALTGPDHSIQHLSREGIAAGMLKVLPVEELDRALFGNWNKPEDCEA